ncbi:hypothetical protein B0H13DRAFT_2344418 [Mycena leptocephala]|nr:hypothetical protein B0H13DRAFT_2344418 [Mycena leptocephala]
MSSDAGKENAHISELQKAKARGDGYQKSLSNERKKLKLSKKTITDQSAHLAEANADIGGLCAQVVDLGAQVHELSTEASSLRAELSSQKSIRSNLSRTIHALKEKPENIRRGPATSVDRYGSGAIGPCELIRAPASGTIDSLPLVRSRASATPPTKIGTSYFDFPPAPPRHHGLSFIPPTSPLSPRRWPGYLDNTVAADSLTSIFTQPIPLKKAKAQKDNNAAATKHKVQPTDHEIVPPKKKVWTSSDCVRQPVIPQL